MLFNSWPFVTLVLISGFLYYTVGRTENRQIMLLIGASLFFYGYGQATLLLLLVSSIAINSISSYQVATTHSKLAARSWAFTGISANLIILASFKYGGLIANSFASNPQDAGGIGAWLVQLPLPIGISFYTFQGISLLADTFSGDNGKRKKNIDFAHHFRDTFLFISFFPQLVAGPVLKSKQFIPQIKLKSFQSIKFRPIFHCLVTGYFLKIVVADNIKDQTFWIQSPYFQFRSSADLVLMLIAYSAQIFADFAGYSLIAIGVAKIFGYKLPKNFNFPYVSTSISEFWRRWHISLSSWLREYLYLPLGGNRVSKIRTYLNLMIVMFLGGLWHGAAWSFAIWGLWHGAGLAIERMFTRNKLSYLHFDPRKKTSSNLLSIVIVFIRWITVFLFVSIGWLFFKLTAISEAFDYLASMAENWSKPSNPILFVVCMLLISSVAIYHALHVFAGGNKGKLGTLPEYLYGIMLFLIVSNAGSSAAFVYFQF